ncbi:MAG: PolC-type DNA polymerase III, partial [Clostridia bacterium]|nr:PolC-type DNA polymerase III [Clostridia bacterium]
EHNVPEGYIDSCKKIKYMFPKAHAAAYVMSAFRLGWYKVYHPVAFYAAYFTAAPDGFDGETVMGGKAKVKQLMDLIDEKGREASATEKDAYTAMQIVNECFARGIKFLPVDLYRSDSFSFLPEDGAIRMPFSALNGIGENAAKSLVSVREEGEIISREELQQRSKVTKSVMEILAANGVLDGLSQTNQLRMF